jgi:hypothetical protein
MAHTNPFPTALPLLLAVPIALAGFAFFSVPEQQEEPGSRQPIMIPASQVTVDRSPSRPPVPLLAPADLQGNAGHMTEYKFADQVSVLAASDDMPEDPQSEPS